LRTFTGNPSRTKTTNECPAPIARALRTASSTRLGVVARPPHEPRAGRLAERDAEPEVRRTAGERAVEIGNGLDEMRLTEDHVQLGGLVDADRQQFHDHSLTSLAGSKHPRGS